MLLALECVVCVLYISVYIYKYTLFDVVIKLNYQLEVEWYVYFFEVPAVLVSNLFEKPCVCVSRLQSEYEPLKEQWPEVLLE